MAFRLPVSQPAVTWTDDDVERWLNDWPLPAEFVWRGQRVLPRYTLKKGYGFWLRTTPYHQGLFEIVRDILLALPAGAAMPTPEELAQRLVLIEREQGLLPLDNPPEADSEPTGNPTLSHPQPAVIPAET